MSRLFPAECHASSICHGVPRKASSKGHAGVPSRKAPPASVLVNLAQLDSRREGSKEGRIQGGSTEIDYGVTSSRRHKQKWEVRTVLVLNASLTNIPRHFNLLYDDRTVRTASYEHGGEEEGCFLAGCITDTQ